MAAISGITASQELRDTFSAAVETKEVRFIKVVIRDEFIVPVTSLNMSGSLEDDLTLLQDILEDSEPAYVLARLDDPASEWLVIFYVPDTAQVRQKMLYASTRNALTKSLGSTVFTDSIFATSKLDISPESYAAHKKHVAAPKPLTTREQEMADIKAAERESGDNYQGSRARQNHIGTGVGLAWSPEAEDAVKELSSTVNDKLVLITIDTSSESLVLSSVTELTVEQLHSTIPASEPSYSFFAWSRAPNPNARGIVFIYSCPSSSPVKHRMLYSSGSSDVFQSAKTLLSSKGSSLSLLSRKVETSDPKELDEAYLTAELIPASESAVANADSADKKSFARPKGPGRRR